MSACLAACVCMQVVWVRVWWGGVGTWTMHEPAWPLLLALHATRAPQTATTHTSCSPPGACTTTMFYPPLAGKRCRMPGAQGLCLSAMSPVSGGRAAVLAVLAMVLGEGWVGLDRHGG